jgi:eukaryotic-like serine/threonine-protein kinase
MGEVYRAHDSQLNRDVAIKVLPESYSAEPERLLRFQQEAKATAALNHPNIVSIYQIGEQDHSPYIVTELLQGETLRAVLGNGRLSVRKALDYAAAMANGLAAAHEQGIVHRDLKPENLFITKDGRVKILDFGLAKLTEKHSDSGLNSPTVDVHTSAGKVLGTVGYMAPEQLRGQNVDARTDIFALGAILYEMLGGRRAFEGPTAADTQTAILREEPPDLPSLNRQVTPALDRIVRHCLEKSPEHRFQSTRDLAFQLESMKSSSESGSSQQVAAVQEAAPLLSRHLPALQWLAALALTVIGGTAGWWIRGRAAGHPSATPIRFQRLTNIYGLEETPAISPDGKSVAFVSDASGSRQILVRLLAGGTPLQITHGDGDHLAPRWAHDSSSIFYYTPPQEVSRQATVWEVPALGGEPRRLLESLGEIDASHDGKSLAFFRLQDGQIQLVRSDREGGNTRVLAHFASKLGCREPRWSHDDSQIAFIEAIDRWTDDLYVVPSAGGDPGRVSRGSFLLQGYSWLPDDSGFVYSSNQNTTLLYLPALHLWRSALDGSTQQQLTFGEDQDGAPDVDSEGRIALSRRRINTDIWKFPVAYNSKENVSRALRITHQTAEVQTPTLSPDDKQLAYLSDSGGHGNLWIMDLNSQQSRQITYEKDERVVMGVPLWAPDGSLIAYARQEQGNRANRYWLVRPDGSDNHAFLENATWLTWSWDARWAYYVDVFHASDLSSIRLMKAPLTGGSPIEIRKELMTGPAISRDGSTLYYAKALEPVNGLWDYEIRAASPETGQARTLARIAGRRVPAWQGLHPVISRDGKWLAMPLNDRFGTNIWLLSTATGELHQMTDFGDRRIFIARRFCWTSDDKSIFAAVGDGDADIVLIQGLLR